MSIAEDIEGEFTVTWQFFNERNSTKFPQFISISEPKPPSFLEEEEIPATIEI